MKNQNLALTFILTTVGIDAIGIGLIFPVMPDLMTDVTHGTLANAALWGGIITSVFAVMQFLCGPIIGNLSDHFGRRPVLLISLAFMAADYIVMALASTVWLLLLTRIVAGITAATHSTASAYLADISTPEERAKRFGLMGAAFGLGFVAGPLIGGLLATLDPRAPFWAAAALAAANLALGLFTLPESLSPENRRPFTLGRANPLASFSAVRRLPGLKLLLTVFFIYALTFNVWPAIWSYYGKEAFGWDATWIGISLAIFGICMAVFQATLIGPMTKALGDRKSALIGMGFEVTTYTFFGFVTSGFWALWATPISAAGGVTGPALQSMMTGATPADQQGELQGIITSINALASILAPVVMTAVFGYFTSPTAPLYLPGAPFILSAVVMVAAVVLFVAGSRAKPAPLTPSLPKTGGPNMKLKDLEIFVVAPPAPGWGGRYWIFPKLTTDDGIVGYGECYASTVGPKAMKAVLEDVFERHMLGQSPEDIELMFRRVYSSGFTQRPDPTVMGAFSGLEIACWDILGKARNRPVWALLGGRMNDRIRSYTYLYPEPHLNAAEFWVNPDQQAEEALRMVNLGFTAVKFDPAGPYTIRGGHEPAMSDITRSVAFCKAIREAVGDRADLLFGTHGQFTTPGAIRLGRELEPYNPLWYEEPIPPDNLLEFAEVAKQVRIPLATGERMTTKAEFGALLRHGGVKILQPALGRVGGIWEAKKIAAMAEVFNAEMAPHLYAGPVEWAANIHFATSIPNLLIAETIQTGGDFHLKLIKNTIKWEDGYILPPNSPGLGIDFDEDVARAHPFTGTGLHLQMQEAPCDYRHGNRFEGGAPAPSK